MPSVRKINKVLNKTFDGRVEASSENGMIVLTGEVERWNEAVAAGKIAAAEQPDTGIINEITCTAERKHPVRKPRIQSSKLDGERPDVLIIGGGVIGCAAARELSRYKLSIMLVEKEHDVAMQASGHCTGLVHSGVKLRRGSQKYWYTVQGNQKLTRVCEELGVPFERCGQYFIYKNRLWVPFLFLSQFYWWLRGLKRSVIVHGEELRSLQPGVGEHSSYALYFPTGGIIDPHALTIAYAENSVQNGAYISFNTIVQGMETENGAITAVRTNCGTLYPKVVVNAAGVFCDDIAAMAGDRFYSIHPVKGTNIVLGKSRTSSLVNSVISSHRGLDFRKRSSNDTFNSVMRSVHGSVLAGPFNIETINKEDFSTDRISTAMVIAQAEKIVPKIDKNHVMTYYSGVSAAAYGEDFIVSEGRNVSNMIHAAGIQFPGLTAAPAIAEDIAKMVAGMFGGEGSLKKNPGFNPRRETSPVLRDMDTGARENLIAQDPDYGIIVCHCGHVSRGEITDALSRNVKCDTIDGVKRRVRTGCGNCQGACCTPGVLEVISAVKRQALHHVRKSGNGSELVYGNAATIAEKKASAVYHPRSRFESSEEIKEKLRHVDY